MMLSSMNMHRTGAMGRCSEAVTCSLGAPLLRLHPDKVRSPVACGSTSNQARRFRKDFKPVSQVEGIDTVYGTRWDEAKMQADEWARMSEMDARFHNPLSPPKEFWSRWHPDEVSIKTKHANQVRLYPSDVPGVPPGEEEYVVEMHRNYDTEWPTIQRDQDGNFVYRPGFLNPITDPELPLYFFVRGIIRIRFSPVEQVVKNLTTALFIGLHAAVALFFWESRPAFVAAVIVSYMRNTLSFGKWAILAALTLTDKTWIYWAAVISKEVDKYLAAKANPLRNLMWLNFVMWVAYMALSPVYFHPLPFWPFAPGSQGLQEAAYNSVGDVVKSMTW